MVTGIDLIKEQFKIASGYRLGIKQEDAALSGWSIECRINAEDPTMILCLPEQLQNTQCLEALACVQIQQHLAAIQYHHSMIH